MGKKPT
jgi:histone H2B